MISLGGLSAAEYALEKIWGRAASYYKGHERDFLRELHGPWGLKRLSRALISDLSNINTLVSLSSIWIDHTPQCWFGGVSPKWRKPSCELADLLVVVWDDMSKRSGKALLLQGKMAVSPDRLFRVTSTTKKELHLLESSPPFLLSNQTSVAQGAPKPYVAGRKNEFCLGQFGNNPSSYRHCRILQIRHKNASTWMPPTSSWQSFWPTSGTTVPYSRTLAEMVAGMPGHAGVPFQRHGVSSDWEELVNLLIDSTVVISGRGTVHGTLQNNGFSYKSFSSAMPWDSQSVGFVTSMPVAAALNQLVVDANWTESLSDIYRSFWEDKIGDNGSYSDIPNAEFPAEPPSGIPVLFVTPYRLGA